jgi:DNA-binding SARP family transcriptional activator
MAQDGSLGVGILGPVPLVVDGSVIGPADLGGRKPKQLLEILLVQQGEAVPKQRIADLLWGDALPRDPMRTLEAYVSGLRSRLHSDPERSRRLLRSEPAAYRFPLDAANADQWTFDGLVARASAAPADERLRLREAALELVRGEVLADEPYVDWVLALRDLYQERHVELLLDAAYDRVLVNEPSAALAYAEQVLRVQPLRERAHRLVMLARYALGDQELALNAYARCRQLLIDELGVTPMPETERMYLAILDQEPLDDVLSGRPAATPAPVPPRTRFARSGEATIAYQIIGDGPTEAVFAPGWFSHVEVAWEEARYAGFMRRLARKARLLLFDKRGVGMSDPASPSSPARA